LVNVKDEVLVALLVKDALLVKEILVALVKNRRAERVKVQILIELLATPDVKNVLHAIVKEVEFHERKPRKPLLQNNKTIS
jgi:phosphatidylserine/phosphatidylglycerophosphate/cardiolipin synthase-like enzyme